MEKKAWKGDEDASVAELSIERPQRAATSNWRPDDQMGWMIQRSEIEAILKEHDGEARVWQFGAESWVPLRDAAILNAGESVSYTHLTLPTTPYV